VTLEREKQCVKLVFVQSFYQVRAPLPPHEKVAYRLFDQTVVHGSGGAVPSLGGTSRHEEVGRQPARKASPETGWTCVTTPGHSAPIDYSW
jgi:hypothetical protein